MTNREPLTSFLERCLKAIARADNVDKNKRAAYRVEASTLLQTVLATGEVRCWTQVHVPPPPDTPESTDPAEDDDLLLEELPDIKGEFWVDPSYWKTAPAAVLRERITKVPTKLLIREVSDGMQLGGSRPLKARLESLRDLRNDARSYPAELYVKEPKASMKAILALAPDEEVIARYEYIIPSRYELLAAAWRFQAVASEGRAPSRGAKKLLVNALRFYCEAQNLQVPSDRALENVVGHVLEQQRGGNVAASVLVNWSSGRVKKV